MAHHKKSSPWVWVSLVIIIALFVSFILFLDQKIVKSGRHNNEEVQQPASSPRPVIDFYTVLKDRNFDVPEKRQDKVEATTGNQTESVKQHRYILQAGSFREMKDADRRKAELALLGLEAAIKRAEIKGVDYYRVELGPFSDDGFYSQVKNRLISNDIKYIAKSFD